MTACAAVIAVLAAVLALAAPAGAVSGTDTISTLLGGLDDPQDIALGPDGALYTATQDDRIRRIAPDGTVTVVAGTGVGGFSGDGGPATLAQLDAPGDVAFDSLGRMYIADQLNHRIRRVSTDGVITTVAGSGASDFSGDGGPAVAAELAFPEGVALDAADNLFIADLVNNRVRRVDPQGVITTYAGTGVSTFNGDGLPAGATNLGGPARVEVGPDGALHVADLSRVRRIDPLTTVVTAALTGNGPRGIAFDRAGNMYASFENENQVRRLSPTGVVSTVAGTGVEGNGGDGGPAAAAQLHGPRGLAVDRDGSLHIAEIGVSAQRFRTVTNIVPLARATGAPTAGAAPLAVAFDGSGSSDPNGTIISHRWEFGDGSSATGPQVSRAFAAPGGYRTRLTVMDDSGAEASTEVQIAATAPPRCRVLPPAPAAGARGRIDLSVRQLRINQRIYSAALRRARGIEAWLAAGVRASDLCAGGLTVRAFGAPGITTGFPLAPRPLAPAPAPRPVVIPPARPGAGGVSLSVRQLRINQAIASRAVREANALAARLDTGLTGGDVVDGEIGLPAIDPTIAIVSATPTADPPPATRTVVAPAPAGRATFRLNETQLAVNQRIGQAAIRRLNALTRRLETGLAGDDFRPASLTAIDLAPALRG